MMVVWNGVLAVEWEKGCEIQDLFGRLDLGCGGGRKDKRKIKNESQASGLSKREDDAIVNRDSFEGPYGVLSVDPVTRHCCRLQYPAFLEPMICGP